MSSNDLCKACTLLEGLERGLANVAVVRTKLHPSLIDLSFTFPLVHVRRQIEDDERWMPRVPHPTNYGLFHSSSYLRVQLLQQYRRQHRGLRGQLSTTHHVSCCTLYSLGLYSSHTPCIVIVISPISCQVISLSTSPGLALYGYLYCLVFRRQALLDQLPSKQPTSTVNPITRADRCCTIQSYNPFDLSSGEK